MLVVEKEIENFLDRIVGASNANVVKAYEAKIEKLEQQRLVLDEKLQGNEHSNGRFEDFIELSLRFLANPWNIWKSGRFTLKRMVLRLAFSERLAYSRNEGYRTLLIPERCGQ